MKTNLELSTFDVAHRITGELTDLGAQIFKVADSGSIYIKFAITGLGTLRIATHHGMLKYKYRWNIRKDIDEGYKDLDRGVNRYYFAWPEPEEFYKSIRHFASTMQEAKGEEYVNTTSIAVGP